MGSRLQDKLLSNLYPLDSGLNDVHIFLKTSFSFLPFSQFLKWVDNWTKQLLKVPKKKVNLPRIFYKWWMKKILMYKLLKWWFVIENLYCIVFVVKKLELHHRSWMDALEVVNISLWSLFLGKRSYHPHPNIIFWLLTGWSDVLLPHTMVQFHY